MWCMAQLWALSCGLEWVAGVSHGGVGAARRVDRRRFSVRTPPAPPRVPYDMGLYPKCDLTCRSGSIICFVVGRSALWTCQNQRQDRQAATIGTAWSQGSALRGSSDGKEPRGDWHSFEPLVAAYVDAALSPTSETVVAMRLLKLSA